MERIVSAFRKLAVSQHYNEIRIIDICNEAEISASSFYLRFADKDALFEMVFQEYLVHAQEVMGDVVADIARRGVSYMTIEDNLYAYAYHLSEWKEVKRIVNNTNRWRVRTSGLDDVFRDSATRFAESPMIIPGAIQPLEFLELLRMVSGAVEKMLDDSQIISGVARIDSDRMTAIANVAWRVLQPAFSFPT